MQVKEIFVSLEQAEKIFEIINDLLSESKDKQIYVEDEFIISEFWGNNVKHRIYHFNGMDGIGNFHYNKNQNGLDGWYGYHESHAHSPRLFSASFIKNCKGYYQLVEFPERSYMHFYEGFEELVLIKVDTKKENS